MNPACFHRNSELGYHYNTARFVTEKLASCGVNHMETGITEAGIAALVQGERGINLMAGLKADMDALPTHEAPNRTWCSEFRVR
ncbi:hypothetical protein MPLSOD_180009 [Mesorhizobium sp. SOD10]|nr:hypothetical protein MPLSOD_180009 [Mesorhizobium sp. SOD10]